MLLVDDCFEDFILIKKLLDRTSGEEDLYQAETAEEALEILEQENFDCILSDYVLPKMDGLQFLKELRKRGNNTPLIFLIGQGEDGFEEQAFESGALSILLKDICCDDINILLKELRKISAGK